VRSTACKVAVRRRSTPTCTGQKPAGRCMNPLGATRLIVHFGTGVILAIQCASKPRQKAPLGFGVGSSFEHPPWPTTNSGRCASQLEAEVCPNTCACKYTEVNGVTVARRRCIHASVRGCAPSRPLTPVLCLAPTLRRGLSIVSHCTKTLSVISALLLLASAYRRPLSVAAHARQVRQRADASAGPHPCQYGALVMGGVGWGG